MNIVGTAKGHVDVEQVLVSHKPYDIWQRKMAKTLLSVVRTQNTSHLPNELKIGLYCIPYFTE